MVLIDTSIWISVYRSKEKRLGELLWALVANNQAAICGQTYVEFVGGFRKQDQRKEYALHFLSFPFLETNQSAYKVAAEILGKFPRLGSGGAIIAATAMIYQTPLLTLDKDFNDLQGEGLKLLSIE